MKNKSLEVIATIAVSLAGFFVLGLVFMLGSMHVSVRQTIGLAQREYQRPNDDLGALVAYMDTDTHSLKEREQAVWTLGRLRDARALPALEKYYTGLRCDHRTTICQYQLVKALKLCGTRMPIHDRTWYRIDR